MTLYKFNKLFHQQKISVLETKGVEIDSRIEDSYQIKLFQVDAFYLEVYYPLRSIKIIKIEAFAGARKLKPYLEKINVDMLLTN